MITQKIIQYPVIPYKKLKPNSVDDFLEIFEDVLDLDLENGMELDFRIETRLYIRWINFYKTGRKCLDVKIMNDHRRIFIKTTQNKWIPFFGEVRELLRPRFYPFPFRSPRLKELKKSIKAQQKFDNAFALVVGIPLILI